MLKMYLGLGTTSLSALTRSHFVSVGVEDRLRHLRSNEHRHPYISLCQCVLSIWWEAGLQASAGIYFPLPHIVLFPLDTHKHSSFDSNRLHQLFCFLFNMTD